VFSKWSSVEELSSVERLYLCASGNEGELVKDRGTSAGEGAVVAKKDPPRTNRRSKRERELSPSSEEEDETSEEHTFTGRPSLSEKVRKRKDSLVPIRKIKEELASSSESEKEHRVKGNPPRTRKVKEEPVSPSEDEEECHPDQLRTKSKDEIFSSLSEDDEEW
jgi:hypothetical protein